MPQTLSLMPHHDGSALYVDNQRPKLGDKIKVRIRVHSSFGNLKQVLIRQSDSGEGFVGAPMRELMNRHGWVWLEGSIVMWNPQVNYRFFIELQNGESFWLNGFGLHPLDQPDAGDFRINTYSAAPKWATGAVMYQVFPDRFARSKHADKHETPSWAIAKNWGDEVIGKGPGTAEQFYGGDLYGAAEHLEHIKGLGATILYLTPIFPARSNHRYDSSTFDQIDPLLGGNKALNELVAKAHGLGMRVMGDLTANHTGDSHEWFLAALAKPGAPESDFYYFSEGNTKYDSWWGVKSLPKLNWASAELRRRFIEGKNSVVGKWLKGPNGLDGWRIDVANMTGRIREDNFNREVGSIIRETMLEVKPDSFLIGEATADAAPLIAGDGYMGAMTYSNLTRPIWRWLWNPAEKRDEVQLGQGRKMISAKDLVKLHNSFSGTFAWHVRTHNLNALDTHDTGRFNTFAIRGSQRVAAGMQFTFPGIPMIFMGDEFGLEGWNGESSRTPMPWGKQAEAGTENGMIDTYSALSAIRKKHRALTEGSMRWLYASDEALAYVRESKTEAVLVVASRGRDRHVEFSAESVAGADSAVNLFGGGDLRRVGGKIRYDAVALDLQIWRLPSAVR